MDLTELVIVTIVFYSAFLALTINVATTRSEALRFVRVGWPVLLVTLLASTMLLGAFDRKKIKQQQVEIVAVQAACQDLAKKAANRVYYATRELPEGVYEGYRLEFPQCWAPEAQK